MECFVRQAVKAASLATDDFSERAEAVKAAVKALSEIDTARTPPEIATGIFRTVIEKTGSRDAYYELKRESNETVKSIMGWIEEEAGKSFEKALKVSLCGNIIDYGILEDFDVEELIRKELEAELDPLKVERLKSMVKEAGTISFLADNAGEIGLDGILLRMIKKINPQVNLTVYVREEPIINDATIEDACFFNLDKDFEILQTPNSVGVDFKQLSSEMLERIKSSDIIISKGQANYEILSDENLPNIIFLLRAKCPVVAEHIGIQEGSPVILL